MPSWNDGETSSEGRLSALSFGASDGGYTPDWIEDPSFGGIAPDSSFLCEVNKELPERFVAFEGANTGRRFLACAEKNEVENCGFVGWIDPEWHGSLQHALVSLWAKVNETNAARIEEKIDHALLIKNLADDKTKTEKKYTSLIAEVNKMLDNTAAKVRQENLAKLNKDEEGQQYALSEFARMEIEQKLEKVVKERDNLNQQLGDVVKENANLKEELMVLTEVQKHGSEIIEKIQKKRLEEREEMKEEKKKLEYMLYDMLKANNVKKDKLKRIRLICDE